MQKLVITGGIPLEGTVTLQGAKNSVSGTWVLQFSGMC